MRFLNLFLFLASVIAKYDNLVYYDWTLKYEAEGFLTQYRDIENSWSRFETIDQVKSYMDTFNNFRANVEQRLVQLTVPNTTRGADDNELEQDLTNAYLSAVSKGLDRMNSLSSSVSSSTQANYNLILGDFIDSANDFKASLPNSPYLANGYNTNGQSISQLFSDTTSRAQSLMQSASTTLVSATSTSSALVITRPSATSTSTSTTPSAAPSTTSTSTSTTSTAATTAALSTPTFSTAKANFFYIKAIIDGEHYIGWNEPNVGVSFSKGFNVAKSPFWVPGNTNNARIYAVGGAFSTANNGYLHYSTDFGYVNQGADKVATISGSNLQIKIDGNSLTYPYTVKVKNGQPNYTLQKATDISLFPAVDYIPTDAYNYHLQAFSKSLNALVWGQNIANVGFVFSRTATPTLINTSAGQYLSLMFEGTKYRVGAELGSGNNFAFARSFTDSQQSTDIIVSAKNEVRDRSGRSFVNGRVENNNNYSEITDVRLVPVA